MLKNHLVIAFRNLLKNRTFSLLNIGGLSAGLAVTMLIGLYIRDEWSFDRFHEKADRIYRINLDARVGGEEQLMAVTPAPMGPAFVRDYPAVEDFCRFRQWGFISVRKGTEAIEEGNNTYVDSSFFRVFSFPLLEGDPKTALVEPNTMVISEKMAQKYFGATTGIVGRTLRINEYIDRRVTGVMKDMPAQSHMHYDFLFSMSTIEEGSQDVWLSNNFQTYLLLRPGVSATQFPAYFAEMKEKYLRPQFDRVTGSTLSAFEGSGDFMRYSLQNMRDIHLFSDRNGEHEANSDVKYMWIFGIVALMVLLLACVNFMNLSTARSAGRAREVGVRKALGSNRSLLVRQFLTESMLLTLVSFALGIGAVYAALPAFNTFADKDIAFSVADMPMMTALAGLAFVTALVAGSYPAFFLSAFRPLDTLKGTLSNSGKGSARLRSSLVVFQFFTSIALIISVLVVQQQLSFIQNKKLGWEKEQIVMLRNTWWLQGKTLDFKQQLLQIPGIEEVSCVDYFPTPSSRNNTPFTPAGADAATQSVASQWWEVDLDYLPTLGLQMHSGRWFDAALKTDSAVCVINEAAMKAFGWTDIQGHRITTIVGDQPAQHLSMEVVGVVENFHYESLRENIGPMVMTIGRGSGTMALRLSKQADVEKTLSAVNTLFKGNLPSQPFNYRFLDEEFDLQYASERRIGGILGAFAGFAIFIACLGLFGLAAFMAEQRTREIGIRKVLGASVGSLVRLLSSDFLRLVAISVVLAAPLAWYFMHNWLQDFAYHIDLKWWMFALAALVAVGIAFLTVAGQAMRAALANPVRALKRE